MNLITIFVVIAVSIFTAEGSHNSLSKFYEDSYSSEYSCSVSFDHPRFFDCACITGLWILYDTCTENITLAGDDIPRCIRLTGSPISKAVQVVRNREELAVVSPEGKVRLLKPETVNNIEIYGDWALVAGSDWTLIDSSGTKICLSVIESDSYCIFTNTETSRLAINGVQQGCDNFDYFLDPQKCEAVRGEYENICESEPSLNTHSVVKRDTGNSADTNLTAISEDDEDYEIAHAGANAKPENVTDPQAIIADGILDFMNSVLDELLGFHERHDDLLTAVVGSDSTSSGRVPKDVTKTDDASDEDVTDSANLNPMNITFSNPVYEFLEISKRITQKTCPSFYVKPEFLNLAVATFLRLQQVQFKYPETSFKPAGFRRVLQYLRKCEQEALQFNFTDADFDGKVDGNYTAFGQTIELTVTGEYANFDRDPIVESVWKIFFNAHSYCYPFFEKILDHHRFTSWMIPLFQNQINDVWTAGKTTEQSLNGLFGNQIQVQGNLAYCAVSSRLESKYPFDLPRPNRMREFGPSIVGNGTAKTADNTGRRKRRDIDFINYFPPARRGNCLDKSKPLLCPDHVKSFVNVQRVGNIE